MKIKKKQWDALQKRIVACRRCPRLIAHCKDMARVKRKSYLADQYWGKPVPDFGVFDAQLLVLGLAPAAHGANRTGRMFTGDRSGDWLYRAMYKAGFATQDESIHAKDGLRLINAVVAATNHCAPPDNKPTREEIANCEEYFSQLLDILPVKVIVALGGIAWAAAIKEAKRRKWWSGATPKFSHGAEVKLGENLILLGSYHPSQQNTFTKRLTEPMFDRVFRRAAKLIAAD